MNEMTTVAPSGAPISMSGNDRPHTPFAQAPAPPSRPFAIELALAYSRLEPRRRLELEPQLLEAFQRRAATLRAALAPAIAETARELAQQAPEAAHEPLGRLPPFAIARLEDLPAGAAACEALRAAERLATPFRAELYRLDRILAAAQLPAPSPRPPAAERRRQADALRRAFGIHPAPTPPPIARHRA